jgi:mono/diheme cytochrome c family protein
MKLLLRIAGFLLVLVAVVLLGVAGRGHMLTRQKAGDPPTPLRVQPDSSLIPRGRHLAGVICAGCHSDHYSLPLAGATENILHIPKGPTFGHLIAPNLTSGGRLARYDDAHLARAIREGYDANGYPLLVMPSRTFHALSDRDVAALISYLRSEPPVHAEQPPRTVNPLGLLTLGAGIFPLSNMPPVTTPVPDVPEGATLEYGAYLVGALDCRQCHGPDLHGGRKGQLPPVGPDLVGLAATHEFAAFDGAVRRGVSARDGHSLDPQQMPYPSFQNMDSLEVAAIYEQVKSLK